MSQTHRSAIVPYSARQMFDLVADVERYAEFLPWCEASRVLERRENGVVAELEVHRGGVRQTFATFNREQAPSRIEMSLVEGPFKELAGTWQFEPLGEDGCRVRLDLSFQVANPLLRLTLGRVFEAMCNTMVDAFTRRASAVYRDAG